MSHSIELKGIESLLFRLADLSECAKRFFGSSGFKPESTMRLRDKALEAEELRAYAQRFVQADPRFAAELFAAANRHEVQA